MEKTVKNQVWNFNDRIDAEVCAEGVERNLAEVQDWNFDRVREDGRRAWNDLLSRITTFLAAHDQ